ncbi:MAG: pilus assembly protein [Pseudomonadota bacterium]|nr:pilus assembly protein [Pseudomonadota bacterium]
MPTKLLLLLTLTLSTTACVSTTPHWDSQYGQAVRAAIASQTMDPAASANRNQVSGIDGPAALGAQHRYEHSFVQPEARDASMLGK